MSTKIVNQLVKLYWAELETIQNYIANSVNLDGVRAEEIKKALALDVTAELGHAQALAKRIKELGGIVPGSFKFKKSQKLLQPPADTTNVVAVIRGVIAAEEDAIKMYKQLIKMCEGKDYVTQDLGIRSLADEESHLSEFKGYLREYAKK